MPDFQDDEEIAQAILAYLDEHPRAMDTLDGIAEWWLMREQIRVNVNTLTRVLHQLADDGLIEEIGSGTYRRYRRKVPRD